MLSSTSPRSRHTGIDKRQFHERQILDQLEANGHVTQRSLAFELGIALGLTNLLMRRLIRKGWVQVKRLSPRRIIYLITPAGIAAKAELTRHYFLNSLTFYRETRARMRERLAVLSAELNAQRDGEVHGVVFFGVGDVAEVAYLCLNEAGLVLSGVVSHLPARPFLQMTVLPPTALAESTLAGRPFCRLVVMPLQDEDKIRQTLARQRVPPDIVFWL